MLVNTGHMETEKTEENAANIKVINGSKYKTKLPPQTLFADISQPPPHHKYAPPLTPLGVRVNPDLDVKSNEGP